MGRGRTQEEDHKYFPSFSTLPKYFFFLAKYTINHGRSCPLKEEDSSL